MDELGHSKQCQFYPILINAVSKFGSFKTLLPDAFAAF